MVGQNTLTLGEVEEFLPYSYKGAKVKTVIEGSVVNDCEVGKETASWNSWRSFLCAKGV